MKLNKMNTTFAFLLFGIVTLTFNNCAKPASEELAANSIQESSLTSSSLTALSAAISCVDNSPSEFKLYVAKSLNGPWVENGSFCQGQVSYFKMTGAKAGMAVKGCTNPSPGTGCLDLTKHRVFTPSEMSSGNIITTITANESMSYPLTQYSFFLSVLGDKKILLEKVGVALMTTCSESTPPPTTALSCSWQIINPQAVVGGGVNVYPAQACNLANQGAKGSGYYDMGGGNHLAQNYECKCQ